MSNRRIHKQRREEVPRRSMEKKDQKEWKVNAIMPMEEAFVNYRIGSMNYLPRFVAVVWTGPNIFPVHEGTGFWTKLSLLALETNQNSEGRIKANIILLVFSKEERRGEEGKRRVSNSMWLFGRKGPSGFSYSSTAEEVTRAIDGNGLTAIVTGASSGIGAETTRVLAMRGVHVIMAVRNTSAGRSIKDKIMNESPNAKLDIMELELSSTISVRKFASEYSLSGKPLNLLICNAGIMATPFGLSKDNIELQFATNHLGHFLLTNLLLETLKNTAREGNIEGRIVIVSSEAHRFAYWQGIRFDKINIESEYNSMGAYGQSKLANILHAKELTRRFKEEGVNITANSLHPGSVVTNLLHHRSIVDGLMKTVGRLVLKNVQQGAATTCYVALNPQVKGVSGEYFMDSNVATPTAHAKDVELAVKLWEFSLSLTEDLS